MWVSPQLVCDCDQSGGWVSVCLVLGVTSVDGVFQETRQENQSPFSASQRRQMCRFKPSLLFSSFPSLWPMSLAFLPFIDPRIMSASPLDSGLPSCLHSLIQALNFHSGSLTHEVKLNYSHYLAVSLHTHSLCARFSFPLHYYLLRQSLTSRFATVYCPHWQAVSGCWWGLLVASSAAHSANLSLSMTLIVGNSMESEGDVITLIT